MKKKNKPTYIVRPPTAVITAGYDPKLSVGSARPAVFRTSTYVFSSPETAERAFEIALGKSQRREGESVDLIYSRLSHPNAEIAEDRLVPLEPGSRAAAVFNSGMAAISTVFLTLCRPGDAFIYTEPLYGGSLHLIRQLLGPLGFVGIGVPAGDSIAMARAIKKTKNLKLIFIETPANPTLRMTDISNAKKRAKENSKHPLVVVDNTFLGPVFQHPIQHGADLVVYSATKYLAGFSDMLGGVVMGVDQDLMNEIRGMRAILGNILQPDESWLLDSRLATVTFRMNRQSKNAERIVVGLKGHSKIKRIYYPTLFEESEQIRIRNSQCSYPGGVFSIELKGGKKAAFNFLRNLKIAHNAVSLGGMESLACHPLSTTHSEMTSDELKRDGINDAMVRISVGVEDWRDLLKDFKEALKKV